MRSVAGLRLAVLETGRRIRQPPGTRRRRVGQTYPRRMTVGRRSRSLSVAVGRRVPTPALLVAARPARPQVAIGIGLVIGTRAPSGVGPLPKTVGVSRWPPIERPTSAGVPGVGPSSALGPLWSRVIAPLAADEAVETPARKSVEGASLGTVSGCLTLHGHGARVTGEQRVLAAAQTAVPGVVAVRTTGVLSAGVPPRRSLEVSPETLVVGVVRHDSTWRRMPLSIWTQQLDPCSGGALWIGVWVYTFWSPVGPLLPPC